MKSFSLGTVSMAGVAELQRAIAEYFGVNTNRTMNRDNLTYSLMAIAPSSAALQKLIAFVAGWNAARR